jgi:hypothetical protein
MRKAMSENLPFKVVRSNGTDEVLARAMNLLIARGANREAARILWSFLVHGHL